MIFRWRFALPLAHLLLDFIAIAIWLNHAESVFRKEAGAVTSEVRDAFFQEQKDGSATFEPRFVFPSAEIDYVAAGTPPASIVSFTIRPKAGIVTLRKIWDPAWFGIQEAVSFLIWFLVGLGLDVGFFKIAKTMVGYIATRLGLIVVLLLHRFADIAWRIEVVVWMVFGVYIVVRCGVWIAGRARKRTPLSEA